MHFVTLPLSFKQQDIIMIKTYKARVNNNNISYLLVSKNGNQMRYDFTGGNVITNKYPEKTLRNRYAQELLESSELFKNSTIVLEHTIEEFPGESEKLKAQEEENKKKKASEDDVNEIASVTTDAELIAFVNEAAGRTEKNEFHAPSTALKWATANGYSFPNYKPE